jgi:Flp pilus assembly protein TadD
MSELLKAEALDPGNPAVLNNLGLAFYVRGKTKQAEAKFRRAIQLQSNYSDAKNNLARTLIDEDHPAEAIKILINVESDLTYTYPKKT